MLDYYSQIFCLNQHWSFDSANIGKLCYVLILAQVSLEIINTKYGDIISRNATKLGDDFA